VWTVWDAAELIQAATFVVIGLWAVLHAWGFMRNRFTGTRDQQLTLRWDSDAPEPDRVATPTETVRAHEAGQSAGAYAGARNLPTP